MDETASTAFHHHKLFRLIPDELKIKSSFLVVLCTEEWTNVFNIVSFQVNIMLNQVCVSFSMCVGTNEASWETNEEKADSKNSRQPATISKLTTQVLWLFFPGREREEKRANRIKATAQQRQDERSGEAKKDKTSNSSRAPAESWP